MSKALLDALETRVNSAVDTIEGLRTEVQELREERRILEDKLRELLGRIEALDSNNGGSETMRRTDAGKGAYGHSSSD
ncbi:MAG: cell division protein ZapB [SAR324 cluster bacterium]